MLEIHEIRLSAIGRFVEEQVIEFNELGNLVQVDGVRSDTGGSSGSGKSTVFNSLDYLFGLNDIPSSVLQSRYTKEGISVTMKGSYDGKSLVITRGKGKLSVNIDGETTTGSKLAEEKIDQILGMPRKLFRPLLHKRQKEGGFFLQFTPKEIHEFLTDCLGLSEIRKKQELVEKKLKDLTDSISSKQSLLGQAKSGLEASNSAIVALGSPPEKEVDQTAILVLKQASDDAQAVLAPVKLRHAMELQTLELARPAMSLAPADTTALDSAQAELASVNLQINTSHQAHAQLESQERQRAAEVLRQINEHRLSISKLKRQVDNGALAKSEAIKVALEIKKIRESVCPTCEQSWATESAKDKEAELLARVEALKSSMLEANCAYVDMISLEADILEANRRAAIQPVPLPDSHSDLLAMRDEFQTKISREKALQSEHISAQSATIRIAQDEFATQSRSLSNSHWAEMEHVKGQADVTRRAFEIAANKMASYEQSRVRYESTLKTLMDQSGRYLADISKHEQSLSELSEDLLLADELKKAVKGYTSCLFDEALDYIGTAATDIIRAIPNMANATIQLEGIRETKEGKVKEEVNAVISMDGETGIPIKSLSGGERSSVDLAVDLAVIDLLENRTNKGVNLFILDEPFTGLDTVSIEMAIEKLKSLNKRLIIVDHNPEIKEMVESRLLVMRDGQTSKIVQN